MRPSGCTRDNAPPVVLEQIWLMTRLRLTIAAITLAFVATAACSNDKAAGPTPPPTTAIPDPLAMTVVGRGAISARYTAEVWVRGDYAYTTSWGRRGATQTPGNTIYIWTVSGTNPVLTDSVFTDSSVITIGDVQISDDGKLLVVPTELAPGSILIYDLTIPTKPRLLSRYTSPNITRGVHTCEVARVNGSLYAFLSINRSATALASLEIVDLSDPSAPTSVWVRAMGNPFVHDVFVRDGLLFTALWDDGLVIWDIGGGGKGGSVSGPVEMGRVLTDGGEVHNAWWYHDGASGSKKYVFVGQEGPGSVGAASSGDIHVVDISDAATPREVAFLHIESAGTHNFSVDEARGFLYAAYYNAGVEVVDVRGDLGACNTDARSADGRCDLKKAGRHHAEGVRNQGTPVYVWGVHYLNDFVYASDMLNGLWKLRGYIR